MIDINAYLGHYAFRRLRHNTAAELLQLMDRASIEAALVSSAAAIAYRNAQPANEDLASGIRPHASRLLGCAVVNPAYAGWREDLAACHENLGMRALRLYPRWHGYKLTDPDCLDLVRQAATRGMIVTIPLRVEDRRQQSWLVDIPDVPADEIAALLRAVPQAKFVLLNGSGYTATILGKPANGLPANYAVDICLLRTELDDEIGTLIDTLGPHRVLFGTGMPFHFPHAALVKMEFLDRDETTKRRLRRDNAKALLGLP
ncbi:MAG: amidohydrolase family protein [Bryobacterales bacterium]|nr:amidohydrolase family protein [Bryobacterales bacterium]